MYEPYIGCIVPWAGSYVPRGWFLCDGRQVSINAYTALYAVIGYRYGGDARTYFNLPNLLGLAVAGSLRNLPATPDRLDLSQAEQYTGQADVLVQNLPTHTHSGDATIPVTLNATSAVGTQDIPQAGSLLAAGNAVRNDPTLPYAAGTGSVPLVGGTAGTITATVKPFGTGSGFSVDTTPPYVALSYIIAHEGIFPVRPD